MEDRVTVPPAPRTRGCQAGSASAQCCLSPQPTHLHQGPAHSAAQEGISLLFPKKLAGMAFLTENSRGGTRPPSCEEIKNNAHLPLGDKEERKRPRSAGNRGQKRGSLAKGTASILGICILSLSASSPTVQDPSGGVSACKLQLCKTSA